jgi:hypothetical protein
MPGIVLVEYVGRRETKSGSPASLSTEDAAMEMTAEVLTFPNLDEPARVAGVWLRRVLIFAMVAVGVVLTLWILSHVGPVVYGLPAFFRRSSGVSSAS